MHFPLTEQLVRQAAHYELRSACVHCFYFVRAQARCAHEWPDQGQRRFPLDSPNDDGTAPETAAFCKEFELL